MILFSKKIAMSFWMAIVFVPAAILILSSCSNDDESTYSVSFDYTLRGLGSGTIIATGNMRNLEFGKSGKDGTIPTYFEGTASNLFIFQIDAQSVDTFSVSRDGENGTAKIIFTPASTSDSILFTEGTVILQDINVEPYPGGEIRGYFEAKAVLFPGDTMYADGSFVRTKD
jgi:hypothetical protein